jgi:hypothetical protein
MTRREYPVHLAINGRRIARVIIDPHYELKHGSSVDDTTILDLVALLSGSTFEPEAETGNFQYFVSDNLAVDSRVFKLIWLLEKNELYVGVVNAYRRRN